MIIDCALYLDGKRHPGTLPIEGALEASQKPGAFVWIGLYEPTEEEFESVRTEFSLHDLAVEDAIHAHQRPKLDVYDDSLFVVLKTARYDDVREDVEFGEILLFVGANFIVAVRHGQASGLSQVRRNIERQPDLLDLGPGVVLHAIMDRVVDDYTPVLQGLDKDIQEVEKEVFSPSRDNPAERIYKLKREVLEFHQATSPLVDPLQRLSRGVFAHIHPDLQEYFRDVHDHILRVIEQVIGFRDLLTSILEANLTQVSVRQNEDMRKISAWVAIAAVPTALAGIYGMNFRHMPELTWSLGYPLAIGLMTVICVILYRVFRRSGWL